MTSEDDLTAWLREEVTWWLDYARKGKARRPINPMRSHEMQFMIGQCEAELAILDEHRILHRDQDEDFFRRGLVIAGRMPPATGLLTIGESAGDSGCVTCHYERGGHIQGFGACTTVRLLGSGYQHRPGYREEWKP